MNDLDKHFETTTKILFGKPLSPLINYSKWLERRLPQGKNYPSNLSNSSTQLYDYYFFRKIPKDRIAAFDDFKQASEKKIEISEDLSLEGAIKKIKEIAYFVPDFVEGKNLNIKETTVYLDCINLYKSFDIFTTKNSAYLFSTMDSEGLFGCYRVLGKFSIHCYNAININSCFEVDNAKNCSNAFFCHNIENVHDSLFCFNTKSKRYAIANIEVGREKYLEIKKLLLDKILPELEQKNYLDLDIYNLLGSSKKIHKNQTSSKTN